MEQDVLLRLVAGGCRLNVQLPSGFHQTDGLAAQSVYVARNVVQNFLDTKLDKYLPSGATGRTTARQKTFTVSLPDYQINLDLYAEVRLTEAGCQKLHKLLHAALLRANAALLLMLAEHHELERLLTNLELESLFSFVEDAVIKESDLRVTLPHAA